MLLRFNQTEKASATARATDLAGEGPGLTRPSHQTIDFRCGHGRRQALAGFPLGREMHREPAPVPSLESGPHTGGRVANRIECAPDSGITADPAHHHVPV